MIIKYLQIMLDARSREVGRNRLVKSEKSEKTDSLKQKAGMIPEESRCALCESQKIYRI